MEQDKLQQIVDIMNVLMDEYEYIIRNSELNGNHKEVDCIIAVRNCTTKSTSIKVIFFK